MWSKRLTRLCLQFKSLTQKLRIVEQELQCNPPEIIEAKLVSKKKLLVLLISQLGRASKQNTRRVSSVSDLCDSGDEAMSDDTVDMHESETESPSSTLAALLDAVGKERSKDSESDRCDRGDAESTCSTASTSLEESDTTVSPSRASDMDINESKQVVSSSDSHARQCPNQDPLASALADRSASVDPLECAPTYTADCLQ